MTTDSQVRYNRSEKGRAAAKRYRERHPERVKEGARKYREKNRERLNSDMREYHVMHRDEERAKGRERGFLQYHILKNQVFNHYGGPKPKCACCSEPRVEFLSIDHINGGGNEHRRQLRTDLYTFLVREGFPPGYQVLCMNCNFAKSHGGCPHRRENGINYELVSIDKRGWIMRFYRDSWECILIFTRAGFLRGGEYHDSDQHDFIIHGALRWQDGKVQRKGDSGIIPAGQAHLAEALDDVLYCEYLEGHFEKTFVPELRKLVDDRMRQLHET